MLSQESPRNGFVYGSKRWKRPKLGLLVQHRAVCTHLFLRLVGEEGVFVTANGGRGNIWFTNPGQFEFCFANQTQEQMSSYCAVLNKRP